MSSSAEGPVTPELRSSTSGTGERVVLVWRKEWLPASETFVADHVLGLRRWRPFTATCRVIDSRLAVAADFALWPAGFRGYGLQAMFEAHRRSGRLERAIEAADVSLAHSHFGVDACVIAPTLDRLAIPHIVNFHGYDVASALQGRSRAAVLYRRHLPGLLASASAIVVPSIHMRDRLLDVGARASRVYCIPIGVKLGGRDEVVQKGREDFVLLVGRLVAKKGAADLLEAMAMLPEDLRSRPIHLVGDGPLRAELEDLAARRRLRVDFLGHLSPAAVEDQMRRAAVLCVPSRTSPTGDIEATPMVIKEAGALGLPTIGSRHGGIPEAIVHGSNGLLFDEGDLGGLRDALSTVLGSAEFRSKLGGQARATVEDRYDAATQVTKLEDLYDMVAA